MEQRKPKFYSGTLLSWQLYSALKDLYYTELKKVLTTNGTRNKLHGSTIQGITAFPLAGSIWEALINEEFTSDMISCVYKNNLLFQILDEAEKWSVKTKTLNFPKFFFGKTFDESKSIYSDLTSIIQIRNNIVHYKHSLYEGPDKAIKNLRAKKITYPKPVGIECPWSMELNTTECIRFCINTISALVNELSNLETPEYKEQCFPINTQVFSPINEKEVIEVFKEYNVDPKSINNDRFVEISNTKRKTKY